MAVKAEEIPDIETLLKEAKWLEGKTLAEVEANIKKTDATSRVTTKGDVGYAIEHGFFGIEKNSDAKPDIEHLGVEIKTCPLKYNKKKDRLSVKEPLSLNIINYKEEYKNKTLKNSTVYKKNHRIMFVFYIHDFDKQRSEYPIKYVFLWELDDAALIELGPDYEKILYYIEKGKAHEIHQTDHKFLTLCPKHNGCFRNPNCKRSKREQPFSKHPAEIRAFRLKNSYMNLIVSRYLEKTLEIGGWEV